MNRPEPRPNHEVPASQYFVPPSPSQYYAPAAAPPPPPLSPGSFALPPLGADQAGVAAEQNFADNADSDAEEVDEMKLFPISCLDPVSSAIAGEADQAFGVEALPGGCTLAMLSIAVGAGLEIRSGPNRSTRANIYMIGIAPSGGNKGTVFNLIAKPFLDMERAVIEQWRREVRPDLCAQRKMVELRMARLKKEVMRPRHHADLGALHAELKALEIEQDTIDHALKEPCWSAADVTREALASLLAHSPNETLASLSPEARGVMDVLAGRYRNGITDEDIYLSAYSGEDIKIHRKTAPSILLHRPCLTLLWMIQPDKLKDLMVNPRLAESGFFQRCLVMNAKAEPVQEVANPSTISAESANYWRLLLQTLIAAYRNRVGSPYLVSATEPAAAVLRDYYNSVAVKRSTGGSLKDINSYAARWGEQAWRLALVLHAGIHWSSAHEVPLAEETARRAVELAKWFAHEQLSLLSPVRAEQESRRMVRLVEFLRSSEDQSSTLRDLKRHHGIEKDEVEALVKKFPRLIELHQKKPPSAGRPSRCVRLVRPET
jgi:hypothetical protein